MSQSGKNWDGVNVKDINEQHVPPPLHIGSPASRNVYDSHAFMHEDKFDTWLDLQGMFDFQEACKSAATWSKDHFQAVNHYISADTISELNNLKIQPHDIVAAKVTPVLPAKLISYVLHSQPAKCHIKPSRLREHLQVVMKSAKIASNLQVSHLLSHSSPTIQHTLGDGLETWIEKLDKWTPEMLASFCASEDMMWALKIHKELNRFTNHKSPRQRARRRALSIPMWVNLPSLRSQIAITHDVMILHFQKNRYLLDKNLFLECINKMCEIFCTLCYAHMQSGTSMPANHHDFITAIVVEFCDQVTRWEKPTILTNRLPIENNGFIFLKAVEGLGVSELILRGDKEIWINDSLQVTLWRALLKNNIVTEQTLEESRLGKLFKSATVAQIAECLGLVKLAGHPSIEVKKGLKKLYERTHEEIHVNHDSVQRTIAYLTRDLVKNFYHVHKRYPNMNVEDPLLSPAIRRLIHKHTDLTRGDKLREFMQIPLMEWGTVRFKQNAEFDKVEQQITLLKDKSLGIERSKIMPLLIANSINFEHKSLGSVEQRRALLQFLLRDDFGSDFQNYLDAFENEAEWSLAVLEYLVIKLTPKELEEKPEGRMFGASPAVERMRRVVQGYNVMRFMSKYVPNQLLTPDELTMTKKLFSFRKLKELYPDHTVYQVSFDFSKWNNSMRHASIDIPNEAILDKWFKTNIYSKTMLAYESMLVYSMDNYQSDFWEGQEGGIEGLNQPEWCYVFGGGIGQALEQLGVIHEYTVKGDDVRAVLAVPAKVVQRHGIAGMRDLILNQLKQLCQDMGWTLNPQECFVSFSLICTSKQYQYKDTWLPSSSKKMMKLESLSNLVFPTTEDIVSSVFSTAHSACAQTTVVVPCFSSACLVASRIITRDLNKHRLNEYQIAMLMCWPQVLGGPGALPLQTFMVRGENDMLSVSISLLRHILYLNDPYLSPIAYNILNQKIRDPPDYKQFLGDPYSIPIEVPLRPAAVLKNLIRSHMKYWVKNKDLLRLLTVESIQDEKHYIETLISMNPLCPKLITAIFENSPFYLKEEVVAKFMMSSTIFLFFQKGKSRYLSSARAHKQLRRVLDAAKARAEFWVTTVTRPPSNDDTLLGVSVHLWYDYLRICTTQIVQMIRDTCWQKPVKALTYPSLIDQNMLYHAEDIIRHHPNWDVRNISSQVTIHRGDSEYQTDDRSHHYAATRGTIPWLGAKTALKLALPALDADIKSPVLTKILNLLMIKRTGYYLGPTFMKLIDKTIAGLTHVSVQHLDVLMPEGQGGHIAHRVPINSFSLVTMPNVRPNIAQNVSINNESMMILKTDMRNRTINFAARNFYLTSLATSELQFQQHFSDNTNTTLIAIFHNKYQPNDEYKLCEYCCAVVDDEMVRLESDMDWDISRFASYALVGTSAHDDQVLKANVGQAIVGKARRLLRHEYLDVSNEINVMIASAKVVATEFASSNAIFNAAIAAQTRMVPRQELVDVLSVNWMGGTNISPHFSLQVLRALHPETLYRSVLQECFQLYIRMIGSELSTEDGALLDNLQSHLNPLIGAFQRLTMAGILGQLSVGFEKSGIVPGRLIWPARSYNDAHTASMHFLRIHEHLFREIVQGESPALSRMKFFVNMESDDTIHNKLQETADNLKVAACIRVNRAGALGRPLAIITNAIEHYIPDDITEEEDKFMFIRMDGPIMFQWLVSTYLPELCLHLNLPVTEGNYLLIRAFYIALMIGSLQDGDWTELDQSDIMHISHSFVLLTNTADEPTARDRIPAWGDNLSSLNPIAKWVSSTYGDLVLYTLVNLIPSLFDTIVPRDEDVQFLDLLHVDLVGWLALVGSRQLCIMSSEDTERILRAQAPNMGFEVDNVAAAEINILHNRAPVLTFINFCRFQGQNHINMQIDHTLVRPFGDHYRGFETAVQVLPDVLTLRSDQGITLDLSYYFLQSCTMSWTSGRLADIIKILRIDEYFQRFGGPFTCLVTGDGSGGNSKLLLSLFDACMVVYCSKFFSAGTGRQADDASLTTPPYEFQPSLSSMQQRMRLIWNGFYPGDVNDVAVQASLTLKLQQITSPTLLFISDAEFARESYLADWSRYIASFFKIYDRTKHEDSIIIFKMWLLKNTTLIQILAYLRQRFLHFHIIRCVVSRGGNTEIYLVLSQQLGLQAVAPDLELIYSGKCSPRYHIQSLEQILTSFDTVVLHCNSRNQLGRYNTASGAQHWSHIVQLGLGPRPWQLYCRELGVLQPIVVNDLCQLQQVLFTSLTRNLEEQITAWHTFHYYASSPHERNRLQNARRARRTIRVGYSVPITERTSGLSRRLTKLIDACLLSIFVNKIGLSLEQLVRHAPEMLQLSVSELRLLITREEIGDAMEVVWKVDQYFVTVENIEISVQSRLFITLHNYARILGLNDFCYYYIHAHEELARAQLPAVFSTLQVNPCCVAIAQAKAQLANQIEAGVAFTPIFQLGADFTIEINRDAPTAEIDQLEWDNFIRRYRREQQQHLQAQEALEHNQDNIYMNWADEVEAYLAD